MRQRYFAASGHTASRRTRRQLVDTERFGTCSRSMMDITLHCVTQQSEIDRLVEINHDAMLDDPVFHWMALYTEEDEDEGTRAALTNAIDDSCYEIVKAVTNDPTAPGKTLVVGFVHYFRGFIELPQGGSSKGDFQKKPGSDAPQPIHDEARLTRLAIGNGMYTHSRNWYINTIRGQKHQCACCYVPCSGCSRLTSDSHPQTDGRSTIPTERNSSHTVAARDR